MCFRLTAFTYGRNLSREEYLKQDYATRFDPVKNLKNRSQTTSINVSDSGLDPYANQVRHAKADNTTVQRFGNSSFKRSGTASWNVSAEKNFHFII